MTQVSVLKIPDTAIVKSLDSFSLVCLFRGHIPLCAAQFSCQHNPNLGDLGPRLPFCSSSFRITALILEEN